MQVGVRYIVSAFNHFYLEKYSIVLYELKAQILFILFDPRTIYVIAPHKDYIINHSKMLKRFNLSDFFQEGCALSLYYRVVLLN